MIAVKAVSRVAQHTLPDRLIGVLERFAALLRGHGEGEPPDPATDGDFTRMKRDIEALISSDLVAHFAFEEESLFPLLATGEGSI